MGIRRSSDFADIRPATPTSHRCRSGPRHRVSAALERPGSCSKWHLSVSFQSSPSKAGRTPSTLLSLRNSRSAASTPPGVASQAQKMWRGSRSSIHAGRLGVSAPMETTEHPLCSVGMRWGGESRPDVDGASCDEHGARPVELPRYPETAARERGWGGCAPREARTNRTARSETTPRVVATPAKSCEPGVDTGFQCAS